MCIIFYQVGPPRPVFVFPRNENMNNQTLEKALKKPIEGVKSISLMRGFIWEDCKTEDLKNRRDYESLDKKE